MNNPTQSEAYELGVQAIRFVIRNCSIEQWREAIGRGNDDDKRKMAKVWKVSKLPYREVFSDD